MFSGAQRKEWQVTYSVSAFQPQVIVLDVQFKVGKDELKVFHKLPATFTRRIYTNLFPDLLPNDSSHLVAIELDNRVLDHDFVD